MGLFDKKYCSVCGEKIGLLGNRKLEDGNLCKECAAKLSPWFDERRHSTVDDIKGQLEYREENKAKVDAFHVTRSFGQATMLFLDEDNHKFMVCQTKNRNTENPDVLDYSQVTGCDLDIEENRREEMHESRQSDGTTRRVSYNPKRYSYNYNFWMRIRVNSPYFNEIKFKLNRNQIEYDPNKMMNGRMAGGYGTMGNMNNNFGGMRNTGGMNRQNNDPMGSLLNGLGAAVGQIAASAAGAAANINNQNVDPRMQIPDYLECYNMGQDIKAALLQIQTQVRDDINAANAPKVAMTCPFCGATTIPDASGRCEFCGGVVIQ